VSTVHLQGSLASEGKQWAKTLMNSLRWSLGAKTKQQAPSEDAQGSESCINSAKGVCNEGLRSPVTRRDGGGGLTLPTAGHRREN
jgi:hypothetical protein